MVYINQERDPTEGMFERLSKNPDVERGLQKLDNPNEAPEVREMARTVLHEVEKGRRRIERRKIINWIVAFAIVIVIIIAVWVAVAKGRSTSSGYHY